ncbi:MAG: adenine-specific DNA-methyltransferase [Bacteroidota bacterium]|jgi:adenine-specific DNA-methyltransferase|nr:adenine-specific DNA-methyltransferase [Bacteroidota bacterium]
MSNEQTVTTNIKASDNDWEILKKHFPQCFDKNGNFQFEKFKNNLKKKEIRFSTESYGLEWLGKSYARLLASDEATTLLREVEEHNQKPENQQAENLLIKGDNLEVLKHLANAYHEKIKMIYIDPPYNTGSDGFVYEDDRRFTVKELQVLAGVDEEQAKRILDFTQSHSNSHSAWLTFMYPRLYIARQLLKDDGVIFVSIDDNEVAQLRLLMDEIFGEENFVAELPTIMNLKGNNDQFAFSGTHEYTMVFSKNKSKSVFFEFNIKGDEDNEWEEDEKGLFKKGSGLLATSEGKYREDRPFMYFPILIKENKIRLIEENEYKKIYNEKENKFDDNFVEELREKYVSKGFNFLLPIDANHNKLRWTWGYDGKFKDYADDVIVIKTKNGYTLNKKQRPSVGELPTKKPKTLFYRPEYSSGNGTAQIKALFGDKFFSNPKPIELIKDFITIGSNYNDIILDFFAGSGTTGDAVMQFNAETSTGSASGNRKFILVQLPEPIDPKKNKVAYDFVKNELKAEPTIFEITKERLIRAANKINRELDEKNKKIELRIADLESQLPTDETKAEIETLREQMVQNENLKTQNTFKIFETMPIWENYRFEAEDFDPQQELFDIESLTEEDLKALLVTWKTYDGIPLTQDLLPVDLPLDKGQNKRYTAYYGSEKLYLMHRGFTTETLRALLEKIDSDKDFDPKSIIAFGYHFDSKNLRELAESVKHFNNKKNLDIDFIIRY